MFHAHTRPDRSRDADAELRAATQGVLFLIFMPGNNGLLPTVRQAAESRAVGAVVVSELLEAEDGDEDEAAVVDGRTVTVDVIKGGQLDTLETKIVELDGLSVSA